MTKRAVPDGLTRGYTLPGPAELDALARRAHQLRAEALGRAWSSLWRGLGGSVRR
jgi:hypothetical protein